MRHFCYSIILILAICFQASARDNSVRDDVAVSGGIKADMAFLNFLTGNAPKAVSTYTPGASVGGFACIDFKDWIGLQPEFNLNYKRSSFGWESKGGMMTSMGIEIPIYVMFHVNLFKSHRINIGVGPYTEFTYMARWEIDGRKVDLLEIKYDGNPMIQDSQSGFGAIFGYEFGNRLAISVAYKVCYYNFLQPNSSQGVSLHPQTASIGISYRFKTR